VSGVTSTVRQTPPFLEASRRIDRLGEPLLGTRRGVEIPRNVPTLTMVDDDMPAGSVANNFLAVGHRPVNFQRRNAA
jgi:hypothetical protein